MNKINKNDRFSKFIEELSITKQKFNSQINYKTLQTEKNLNLQSNFESQTTPIPLNNYLTHSVMEIFNKSPKKRIFSHSPNKKKEKHLLKKRIELLIIEISAIDIEFLKKKGEVFFIEGLLQKQEKAFNRLIIILENDYDNINKKNKENMDEIENLQRKTEDLLLKIKENERKIEEFDKKKIIIKLKSDNRGFLEEIECLKGILEEKRVENTEISDKIAFFDRKTNFNKKSIILEINRKNKEISYIKNEIDQLDEKFTTKENSYNEKKLALNLKKQLKIDELLKLDEKINLFTMKKTQEKEFYLEKLNQKFEPQNKKQEKKRLLFILKENLSLKIEERVYKIKEKKEFLLRKLEEKGDLIKKNVDLLQNLKKKHDLLEKTKKELEEKVKITLKTCDKTIESKKEKNKLLKSVLQSLPSKMEKESLLMIVKNEEKEKLIKEIEFLKEETENLRVFKTENNEKIKDLLILESLEGDVEEIRNSIEEKQKALSETKGFCEKLKELKGV